MEITRHQEGAVLELRVAGRLDAYWADHLRDELQEAIRGGAHQIQLDFSGVTFLSSAGLRALLTGYQQLSAIQGSLSVVRPSPGVQQVLEMAGFDELLVAEAPPPPAPGGTEAGPSATVEPSAERRAPSTASGASFEVFPLAAGATLRCRLVGEPERLTAGSFGPEQCHRIPFADGSYGVGLGAPGSSFAECRERFGEFLAVAGSAAYLPTDGTNVPDYLLAAGTFVPELQVLYGLICEGAFALLARFEGKEEGGRVRLSRLAGACLEMAGSEAVGIVVVAQSAGLVGASLRRSPGMDGAEGGPFRFPEIRQWLSFTPERAHTRSLVLLAGVAARGTGGRLAPVLRPLASDDGLTGHFHAAAFSYRPLQRGALDLKTTVGTLFEAETLQGVLHLLNDDRPITGAGESEFVRGACWISPITEL
jgi:anti-anti-sigma factor